VKIPFVVAATYAFFEEWITGRIRGKEPRATLRRGAHGAEEDVCFFRAGSAGAWDSGLLPVYPAMRSAIEWFRAHGYAPPGPCMTRVAIIAAMAGELKPLVRGWEHERRDGVECVAVALR
jgi:hypothetical protein